MILKNKELTVKIHAFGAELKSIVKNDIEYLWQADPAYWKRSSPVLFPIVGRLIDNQYIYKNKTYTMTQHGFARDHMFELVSHDSEKALYKLSETKESLAIYPFKFNLYIGYKLNKNELNVSWTVENTNAHDMYFQIGAHPAFNFFNGSKLDINKKTTLYELQGHPQVAHVEKDVEVGVINIGDQTFKQDANIYGNLDEITLRDEQKSVTLKTKGFPYLGVWTQVINGKNAPFICLEPWHGITDFMHHNKQFVQKVGINTLKSKSKFHATYTMIFT